MLDKKIPDRKIGRFMAGQSMVYGTMVYLKGEYIYKADSNCHVLGMIMESCHMGQLVEVLLLA